MENHGVFAAFGAFKAFCSTPERCLLAGRCMAYEGKNSGKACQAFLILTAGSDTACRRSALLWPPRPPGAPEATAPSAVA